MLVDNLTSYDIYFGPLRLAAGATGVTIDDTSDTSLYLTDDAVADALNNAYTAGKIHVSGEAQPFPRPTGDPELLHGLGSPEGSVYAAPGSLMMRRDTSGAGNALYAKTTARTSSTGWQSFRVPVASAISAGPPPDPLDGDIWIATSVDGNGTRWAFQYDAGSGSDYKWEFIGGSPVENRQEDTDSTASTTYVDIGGGPALTLARAGDYLVSWESRGSSNEADVRLFSSVSLDGVGLVSAEAMGLSAFGSAGNCDDLPLYYQQRITGLPAGAVIRLVHKVNSATGYWASRGIYAKPVRIA